MSTELIESFRNSIIGGVLSLDGGVFTTTLDTLVEYIVGSPSGSLSNEYSSFIKEILTIDGFDGFEDNVYLPIIKEINNKIKLFNQSKNNFLNQPKNKDILRNLRHSYDDVEDVLSGSLITQGPFLYDKYAAIQLSRFVVYATIHIIILCFGIKHAKDFEMDGTLLKDLESDIESVIKYYTKILIITYKNSIKLIEKKNVEQFKSKCKSFVFSYAGVWIYFLNFSKFKKPIEFYTKKVTDKYIGSGYVYSIDALAKSLAIITGDSDTDAPNHMFPNVPSFHFPEKTGRLSFRIYTGGVSFKIGLIYHFSSPNKDEKALVEFFHIPETNLTSIGKAQLDQCAVVDDINYHEYKYVEFPNLIFNSQQFHIEKQSERDFYLKAIILIPTN